MLKSKIQTPNTINYDIIAKKLTEVGKKLSPPPSDVRELITLLDELELCLSRIGQSPPEPLCKALEPAKKAIIMKEYLEHQDKDIKLAVTTCVTEITRITAPDAPFDDDTMKDIFRLIVGAFEELHDYRVSSTSCQRRISILETVARVQSSVIMLDLECDDLVIDMFHHFLKNIRDTHPQKVFSSMMNIMALVIVESEDILPELVSVLLDTLKIDNKDVSPAARKLAKSVMNFSANKIRTCLMRMVELKRMVLSEYNAVVASVYQGVSDVSNSSNEVLEDDSKLSERTVSDDLPQASTKEEKEVGFPEIDIVSTNGNIQIENDNLMEQPHPLLDRNLKCVNAVSTANVDNLDSVAANEVGTSKPKKLSRKSKSSAKKGVTVTLIDSGERNDQSKNADITQDVDTSLKNVNSEEIHDNPSESQPNSSRKLSQIKQKVKSKSFKGGTGSKNDAKQDQEVACPEQVISSNGHSQENNVNSMEKPSSPILKSQYFRRNKNSKSKKDNLNLDSVAAKHTDTSISKSKSQKNDSSAKKDTLVNRIDSAVGNSQPKKTDMSQGNDTIDINLKSEKNLDNATECQLNSSKKTRQSKQKVKSKSSKGCSSPKAAGKNIDNTPEIEVTPLMGGESKETDNADGTNKHNAKKGSSGMKGLSKRKLPEDESENKLKSSSKKQKNEDPSTEDVDAEPTLKEFISTHKSGQKTSVIDQTSKAKLKSKKMHAVDTEKCEVLKTEETVVGFNIRVWWPEDEMFYAGVVESYDPNTGKHKIVYTDGEIEDLLLEDERYEFAEGDLKKLENNQTTEKAEGSSSKASRAKKSKKSSNIKSNGAKSDTQLKSVATPSSEVAQKSTGRSKGNTPTAKISSNDTSPNASKKPESKTATSKKPRTPKTSTKQKDDTDNETPKTNTKLKEETPKSNKKLKARTPLSTTKSTTTPKTEAAENKNNKGQMTKPKRNSRSTSKTTARGSKVNAKTSSSKSNNENESTLAASEGKTSTGGKKRNRKGGQR